MQACRTQTRLKSMILGIQWIKEEGKKAKSWWERKRKEDRRRGLATRTSESVPAVHGLLAVIAPSSTTRHGKKSFWNSVWFWKPVILLCQLWTDTNTCSGLLEHTFTLHWPFILLNVKWNHFPSSFHVNHLQTVQAYLCFFTLKYVKASFSRFFSKKFLQKEYLRKTSLAFCHQDTNFGL